MAITISLTELLTWSGLVEKDLLAKVQDLSKTFGLGSGNLLVENELISKRMLEHALELMLQVNSGQIQAETAVSLLRMAKIQECYRQDSELSKQTAKRSKPALGELLLAAGVLSSEKLASAIISCEDLNMRLGQYLVLGGIVPPQVIEKSLQLQNAVRDNMNMCGQIAA